MSNETKQVEVDFNNVYTMDEAKKLLKANKGPIGGLQFYATNGTDQTLATVLPDLSPRGKVQAILKCLAGGPDHIREQSDWHQALRSPEMAKKSKKAVASPSAEAVPA